MRGGRGKERVLLLARIPSNCFLALVASAGVSKVTTATPEERPLRSYCGRHGVELGCGLQGAGEGAGHVGAKEGRIGVSFLRWTRCMRSFVP